MSCEHRSRGPLSAPSAERWSAREPLGPAFFARPTLEVARELLGALLVHELPDGPRVGRIVEVEAYIGPEDRGSHAYRGRTARTWPMFGPPGRAYVYLIYGLHHCLNIVTEPEDYPAAILLRALEPVVGLEQPASGPGRLCRAMGVDRRHNGMPLTEPPLYVLPAPQTPPAASIACGPRIGIEYAGEWAERPWRFWLTGNPHVSRPGRARRP